MFLTTRCAGPQFRRQGSGGVILNIVSTGAVRPRAGLTWYNAMKGAVATLTKSLAIELAPDSVRAKAIRPVLGATGLFSTFISEDTLERRARFIQSTPLGRLCTPADVAAAAAFLVSDEAAFMTGACLEVDGGRCI